ncbi:MAG: hypothetical protein RR290_00985 [Clostridia bacterium]
MKKFSGKTIAMFLSMAMIFSISPVSAYAQTPEHDVTAENSGVSVEVMPVTNDEGIATYSTPQQQYRFSAPIYTSMETNNISFTGDRLTSHIYVGPSTEVQNVLVILQRVYPWGTSEVERIAVAVNTDQVLWFSGLTIEYRKDYRIIVVPNISASLSPPHVIVTAVSYVG